MKATKQPTSEELKKQTIYVRYLVADLPPKEGLKRMTYYTELHERPGLIYFGMSYRRPEDPDKLNYLLKTGQIIELSKPQILPFDKDVWLNENGEVFLLKGYAPWEDLNGASPVARPKELNPGIIAIKDIKTKPIPYHELP